jgi:hypothetical protein
MAGALRPAAGASAAAEPGAPQAVFVVKPNPPTGPVPLDVRVNMCKSTDDPGTDLRFTVDWGDGVKDRGSCRLGHTYESAGTFRLKACVSDREPDHAVCQEQVVEAGTTAPPEPEPTPFAVLEDPDGFTSSGTGTGVVGPGFPLSGSLTAAEANSATRVVVTIEITVNSYASVTIGLMKGTIPFVFYEAGAPDIGGRTGTVVYELTPGQFSDGVTANSFRINGPGALIVSRMTFAFYR